MYNRTERQTLINNRLLDLRPLIIQAKWLLGNKGKVNNNTMLYAS